jgi:hypothetical protein
MLGRFLGRRMEALMREGCMFLLIRILEKVIFRGSRKERYPRFGRPENV